MLLNFLLAFLLFSNPGGAGSAMDPNGLVTSNGVLLGDGILLGDGAAAPADTSDVGWHIDPNGSRACYTACIDPNG
jgi:hypothetical protein